MELNQYCPKSNRLHTTPQYWNPARGHEPAQLLWSPVAKPVDPILLEWCTVRSPILSSRVLALWHDHLPIRTFDSVYLLLCYSHFNSAWYSSRCWKVIRSSFLKTLMVLQRHWSAERTNSATLMECLQWGGTLLAFFLFMREKLRRHVKRRYVEADWSVLQH